MTQEVLNQLDALVESTPPVDGQLEVERWYANSLASAFDGIQAALCGWAEVVICSP